MKRKILRLRQSLTACAVLLLFGVALQAQTPAAAPTASSPSMPRPATAPERPTLTDAEVKKIDLYNEKVGLTWPLDSNVTTLLGLTAPGEILVTRQLNASDDNDTIHVHYFSRSTTDPNVIVLFYKDFSQHIILGYRTDPQFHYILGYVKTGDLLQKLSPEQGAAGLAAELRWWAKEMDEAPGPDVAPAATKP